MPTEPERTGKAAAWRTVLGYAAFGAVVLGITLLLAWQMVPEVWAGEFLDTDNYMRILRVERLAETGSWYDNSIQRSNFPHGEVLHWTRPLDLLLLIGSVVFLPFLSFSEALVLSGMVLSPVLLLLICFGTAWATTPFTGSAYRFFAMITVLAQVGIMVYALPGRPDHHPLLLLCFVVSAGCYVRVLLPRFRRSLSAATGVVVGVGLWTSPEFLVPAFFIFLAGGIIWIIRGGDLDRKNSWATGGLVAILIVGVVLEQGPSGFLIQEFDRISIVHILASGLLLAFWVAARRVGPYLDHWRSRLFFLGLGGSAAAVVQALIFPKFFRGPTVDVDPQVMGLWLQHVGDNQPMFSGLGLADFGRAVVLVGPALFCLPFLGRVLVRQRNSAIWPPWVFVAVCLVGFLSMSMLQVRFAAYAEVLIVMVTVAILSRLHVLVDGASLGKFRIPIRALAGGGMVTGCIFAGGLIMALGGEELGSQTTVTNGAGSSCRILDLVPVLGEDGRFGGEPQTILTYIDFGPELLYRTDHRVLATPYHRNTGGILGAHEILSATDLDTARGLVTARGVDLILLCPTRTSMYSFEPIGLGENRRLFDRLVDGDPIPWVTPVPLDPSQGGGFLLFEVMEEAAEGI